MRIYWELSRRTEENGAVGSIIADNRCDLGMYLRPGERLPVGCGYIECAVDGTTVTRRSMVGSAIYQFVVEPDLVYQIGAYRYKVSGHESAAQKIVDDARRQELMAMLITDGCFGVSGESPSALQYADGEIRTSVAYNTISAFDYIHPGANWRLKKFATDGTVELDGIRKHYHKSDSRWDAQRNHVDYCVETTVSCEITGGSSVISLTRRPNEATCVHLLLRDRSDETFAAAKLVVEKCLRCEFVAVRVAASDFATKLVTAYQYQLDRLSAGMYRAVLIQNKTVVNPVSDAISGEMAIIRNGLQMATVRFFENEWYVGSSDAFTDASVALIRQSAESIYGEMEIRRSVPQISGICDTEPISMLIGLRVR